MIILARHGETVWNKRDKMQGQENSPLTEEGVRSAKKVSRFLNKYEIENIYSSTLGRSVETAKILSKKIGTGFEKVDKIKEIDIGCFSGKSKKRVYEEHPHYARVREKNKWEVRWPNGESYSDVHSRVKEFISRAILTNALIVGHKSVNRVIAGAVCSIDPKRTTNIEQHNDEVLIIEGDSMEKVKCKNYHD